MDAEYRVLRAADRPQEAGQRLPVGPQRRNLDVLLGPVVAGADRPELDRRDPAREKDCGVGGAVSANSARAAAGGRAERRDVGLRRVEVGRGDVVDLRDLDAETAHLRCDLGGILPRQVADVEIGDGVIGHAVHGVPARHASEVDGRACSEERRALARERQLGGLPGQIDGAKHGVLAEPRRGAVRRAAAHIQLQHHGALGLDADVQVGGLAPPPRTPRRSRRPPAGRWPSRSCERAADSSSGTMTSCVRTPGAICGEPATSASAASITASAPFMS